MANELIPNREFKFRYFDSKDKKFIYSYYFNSFEAFFCHFDNRSNPLQQYTGINDKDGIEIFEGDIIHGRDEWDVQLIDDFQSFIYDVLYSESHSGLGGFTRKDINIIGNIYETPELLENL